MDERELPRLGKGGSTLAPAASDLTLPPMPAAPARPGLLGAVTYLAPVARAWWSRREALAQHRATLPAEQASLDDALAALGDAAYAERLYFPKFTEDMERITQAEAELARVMNEARAASAQQSDEFERLRADEQRSTHELLLQDQEIARLIELKRTQLDEESARNQERDALARTIAGLERQERDLEARVAAGGDRRQFDDQFLVLRTERTTLAERHEDVSGLYATAQRSVAETEVMLQEARSERARRAQALDHARERRSQAEQAATAAERRFTRLRKDAEESLRQARRHVGDVVYRQRLQHASFAAHVPFIDACRGAVEARQATLARLEAESRGFDRRSLRIGALAIAGALVLLTAAVVALAIAL
ncbi:MAG TPA: hypothetical protein VH877_05275 [Polyangia bacterium]|jgi:chromosome segregation ATPase|nr:hypothetical protein [Polyangia bacterium]